MANTDLIGDMIVRIKNAASSGKETVSFPHSNLSVAVAEALERTGYLKLLPKKGKKFHKTLEATVMYKGETPVFQDARRISKPSKRVYTKTKDIRPVRSGFGHLFISTPKGILTDKEARKEKVGGEALFQIW